MIPIPAGFAGNVIANLAATALGFVAGRARGTITGGGPVVVPGGAPRVRTVQPTDPLRLERQLAERRDLLAAQYRRRR